MEGKDLLTNSTSFGSGETVPFKTRNQVTWLAHPALCGCFGASWIESAP